MKNKREIKENINEMVKNSVKLSILAKDDRLDFYKSTKINKEQDELYKKINFYKNMYKAIEKGDKENEKNKK